MQRPRYGPPVLNATAWPALGATPKMRIIPAPMQKLAALFPELPSDVHTMLVSLVRDGISDDELRQRVQLFLVTKSDEFLRGDGTFPVGAAAYLTSRLVRERVAPPSSAPPTDEPVSPKPVDVPASFASYCTDDYLVANVIQRMSQLQDMRIKDVFITNVNFGTREFAASADSYPQFHRSITVWNNNTVDVDLFLVRLLPRSAVFSVSDDFGIGSQQQHQPPLQMVRIPANTPYELSVTLSYTAEQAEGQHECWLVFGLMRDGDAEPMFVMRRLSAMVLRKSLEFTKMLRSTAPSFYPAAIKQVFESAPRALYYCQSPPVGIAISSEMIRPACHQRGFVPFALERLLMQTKHQTLTGHPTSDVYLQQRQLALQRHVAKQARLLSLEHMQMEVDIRNYDMFNVRFKSVKTSAMALEVVLEVPGLPESRPAVQYGDMVFVRIAAQPIYEYLCYVVEVAMARGEVTVRLPLEFPFQSFQSGLVHVRFSLNRLPLQRMDQALTTALNNRFTIFPSLEQLGLDVGVRVRAETIQLFDTQLNDEQRAAVCNIVNGTMGAVPYLVFGPPGTGKTKTMVEAILQVYCGSHLQQLQRPQHLLVCAPSDWAADLLCVGIARHVQQVGKMLRLNDVRRGKASVMKQVLLYCYEDLHGTFQIPESYLLGSYNIIVCTCSTASELSSRLDPHYFDYIFIDEAGQALEAETYIPLSLCHRHMSGVAMAGDPKQLGPVVRCLVAGQAGLGVSMLARLMADGAMRDARCYTKLCHNYRSQAKLLELPSSMFYDGELIASAPTEVSQRLCDWQMLPNKNMFPLMFCAVYGQQLRIDDSPSLFNPLEAQKIVELASALVYHDKRVHAHEIGVMAPYRKQVQVIRQALRTVGLHEVRVGTVDDYQGQEARVILISTVLTHGEQQPHSSSTGEAQIGFMNNSQRFNVAITRAQELMVVVGHPDLLSREENWSVCIRRENF
eukprot:TRINITY_DN1633_c0_g1_i3.p1 TRINITY_DN1633_c0_g1~~TRINITY_DN1633_c0_g1_i3.p1  ORF type:complete len:960 (+),score=166.97 TRINITY_DN1633_c0_g1_i3:272-3151(+)